MRAFSLPAGTLTLALAGAGVACSDPVTPEATAVEHGLVLSEAIETANAQIVYVSLRAGTVPEGVSATATNLATGGSVQAAMVDGGLDPVALPAKEGDSVEVETRDREGIFRQFGGTVRLLRPPVVVRTGPGRGATDVGLNSLIVVVFSEPMDGQTISPETIELTLDGEEVPVEVTPSSDGLRAEVQPSGLLPLREYILVVKADARDREGLTLENEYRSTFRTTGASLTFIAVSAGGDHTCGVTDSGALYCWGSNGNGQLGLGDVGLRPVPSRVEGVFVSVHADGPRTCGLAAGGVLLCWGNLGIGLLSESVENYTRPERLFSPNGMTGGVTFVAMAVGDRLACGLDVAGIALCRGTYKLRDGSWLGFSESLGDGTHSLTELLDGMIFRQLALGAQHGCGLRSSGGTHCWGQNGYGELGDGTFDPSISANDTLLFTAPSVAGGLTFSAIASGGNHSCGLAEGRVYCWGQNRFGELGVGDLSGSNVPLPVSLETTFATIDAGADHTCGVTSTGDSYCWGANFYGQLGDGTLTDRHGPVRVAGGLTWKSIAVGGRHTCGQTVDGLVYCWGRNDAGQLGDGWQRDQTAPVKVTFQR